MEHYNPYENIANAIVIQACKDYRRAYRRYLRRYRSLTALDGEYIMDRIRKEISA